MLAVLPQLLMNAVIAAALYGLVAVSFNFIFSTAKFFNLAHGSVALVGGYATYQALILWKWTLLPSVLFGVVLAAVAGWVINWSVFQRLRARGSSILVLFVASLGVYTIAQALFAIGYTSQFKVLLPGAALHTYRIFGGVMTGTQLTILLVAILVTLGLLALLRYSRFGQAIRAVADDEEVARVIGIPTHRIIASVFVLGSGIAGLAGILQGLDTGIEPTMGLTLLLKGVIAAVVGGLGSVSGALVGSFLLGLAENLGIWFVSSEWKDAIAFGLLIVFMLFRPYGIMNRQQKR